MTELSFVESNCLYNANMARLNVADLSCGLNTNTYILNKPEDLLNFPWKNDHIYAVGYTTYYRVIDGYSDWPLKDVGHVFNIILHKNKIHIRESSNKEYKYKEIRVYDNFKEFNDKFIKLYIRVLRRGEKNQNIGFEIDILENKIDPELMVYPRGTSKYIEIIPRDTFYQNYMILEALQIPSTLNIHKFYDPLSLQILFSTHNLYTIDFKITAYKNNESREFRDAIFILTDRYLFKVKHSIDYIILDEIKGLSKFMTLFRRALLNLNSNRLSRLLQYNRVMKNKLKKITDFKNSTLYFDIQVTEATKRFDIPVEKVIVNGIETFDISKSIMR